MKDRRVHWAASVCASMSLGCAAAPCPAPEHARRIVESEESNEESVAAPPKLVLVVVYDQMGSDTLERYLPILDEDGAIRRTARRGRYVQRVEYAYAATFTAPGHAAIHSGAAPRDSGIGANRIYSRRAAHGLSTLDDQLHSIHGEPTAFGSPRVLLAPTVADMIQTIRPESVVVSLAAKDRSAILPGGQRPDLALWFEPEAGGFTNSTWYGPTLPDWVVEWRGEHPFESALRAPWEPEDPEALEALLGPDEQPGEGLFAWGSTFPHDPAGDVRAYLNMPASADQLIDLARAAVLRMRMGQDEHPDLLAISIGNTDYIGHAFGPHSWEYADMLRRVDRSVGRFIAELERELGQIGVLITSDHGVAPLAEHSVSDGHDAAVRVHSEDELRALRAHLDETMGAGSGALIAEWAQPYIVLSEEAEQREDRQALVDMIVTFVRHRPGIQLAVDAHRVASQPVPSGDGVERAVALSIPRDPPGDVFVMPAQFSTSIEGFPTGSGTSHGSYWDYDRQVPVVYSGPSVVAGVVQHSEPQCKVAATIAALANIDAPPFSCGTLD